MPNIFRRNNWLRYFLQILFVSGIYFLLAQFSFHLRFDNTIASPVWPASGFAFAMILLWGVRVLPGIFFGALAANLFLLVSNRLVDYPLAILISCIIGLGNAAEAYVGRLILSRFLSHLDLHKFLTRTHHLFYLCLTAALMTLVSSVTGSLTVLAAHIIPEFRFPVVLVTWWLGDFSGVIMMTSFILVWYRYFTKTSADENYDQNRWIEFTLLFIAIIVMTGVIFNNWLLPFSLFNFAYWLIPIYVWAALRFFQKETITIILISAVMAVLGTMDHQGTFGNLPPNEGLIALQGFISIMVITKLALSISVQERKKTEAALRVTGHALEAKVQERTAALEEKNIALQKSNEELSSFAYVASHDLQEPLRKIQMFSNRIIETEEDQLSGNSKDYFLRMKNAARRMQQLIEDLLTYSRTGSQLRNFEIVHIKKIVDEVRDELKDLLHQTRAKIIAGELCEFSIIPFQFRQLLTNLITNSIKFAKPNTDPVIEIQSVIKSGKDLKEDFLEPNKKYCYITVKDNGIGFEPEFNEQIFGLFQRLHGKTEYPGTGIGLSICKKIVENHNGFIRADGQKGVGATFHIYLPHRQKP